MSYRALPLTDTEGVLKGIGDIGLALPNCVK
jgi:hypothetical protein